MPTMAPEPVAPPRARRATPEGVVESAPRARPRSVLLVGATSGIMRAVAREYASRGYDLLLVGRDAQEMGILAADLSIRTGVTARTYALDALSYGDHEEVLDACFRAAGEGLEGVIVGLGYLGEQKRAQDDPAEARRILDTNFTAPVMLLNRVANRLEERGRGFICVLSSVAGDRGRQSNYIYGSAKAGLSAYLQGLRNRMHHAGVQVTTVKPGFVDTSMTYGMDGLFLVASPEKVARGIARAVAAGRDEVYLPGFWRWIMLAIRTTPERLFKRLRL
jgi:decaprenylphospho-beta-D-erythro-pentofuranosid-2-ulose 2-reductase